MVGRGPLQGAPRRGRPPDGLGLWREGDAEVAFCLEYDRGTEPLRRLTDKAADYARLESAWGVPFWLLVVVPGPRREAGARSALAGEGVAAATTSQAGALRPAEAVWSPLGADGTRLRLAELVNWPRSAASAGRLARAARYRTTGNWEEEAG